jgi:hypothetical protein
VIKEVQLEGRLFTWSNERAHLTLEQIDRLFILAEWETLFPGHELMSLPSLCSDHAPLLLCTNSSVAMKRFLFWSFWSSFSGFKETMERALRCPLRDSSPFRRLDWLLRNLARMLKSWSDHTIGNIRGQLEVAKEMLFRFKQARDFMSLAPHEDELRKLAKLKTLALASLQRSIARQESRLLWLKEGDASTKFFNAHANGRCHRNYVRSLMVDGEVVVFEERKADAAFCYFDQILGTLSPRSNSISLDLLNLPYLDPAGMGARFTEAEVWATIKGLPPDKSPGPNGFTTRFLQVSWELIRPDIMAALDAFWRLDTRDLHATNDAFLVLLLKSLEAVTIRDYRLISLIHLIGKIISKILANRLAL